MSEEAEKNYLGEFPVVIADSPFKDYTSANWALYYVERYGGIDGAHHKDWVLDQVARILNGAEITVVQARWRDGQKDFRVTVTETEQYHQWVKDMKDGEDGPDTYGYDEGIAT